MPPTLEDIVRRRIQEKGPIPFAEFMEMALYHPAGGYYRRGKGRGARGDYFTSPQAHPAFGALLAVQVYQVWEVLGRPSPFVVAEQGAGDGLLALAFMDFAERLTASFAQALRYVAIDLDTPPSPDWARQRGGQRLRSAALPLRGVVGCLIANEMVDAFPVHRWRVKGGSLEEAYVALRGDGLGEMWGPPSTPALEAWVRALGIPLVEGTEGEACVRLPAWTRDLATALGQGLAIIIDYGGMPAELYRTGRGGTVRAFRQHMATGDLYRHVGQQDITASVDFASLVRCAREAGLEVMGWVRQRVFLRNLGWDALRRALVASRLPPAEAEANRFGLQALVQEEGLGGYGVLLLGKGVPSFPVWGVDGLSPDGVTLVQGALAGGVPLLTPAHAPLLQGRYPHQAVGAQALEVWTPSCTRQRGAVS
ncbi:MAG: SAM-dependent methyltransferase [Dehalococcoidia bacterium]|nr:SAM-dependent methyltransferase [Dehalococcoidia bacterium]MDW8119428.1 SAM-dependent methyltransferase [Chloroflexota bacterium]